MPVHFADLLPDDRLSTDLPEYSYASISSVFTSCWSETIERYKEFIGMFDDLPADFARNHDHYTHGTPKK